MINPELLTDDLAAEVAEEVICTCCADNAVEHIAHKIATDVKKELLGISLVAVNELKRRARFEKLFKSLVPYEKLYKTMLAGVWAKQEKIIIANLKKMKKAWLSKDKIDDLLYPVSQFEKELSSNALEIDLAIIDKQGKIEMAQIAATDVVFDVTNPEVQNWLKSYTPKFSKALEEISTTRLRRELIAGMGAGEGIPDLMKRVNNTYAHWNKVRSETIARSEALRASNRASIEAYKQSGVVKKKVWITHIGADTCEICRSLNNKIISIEKNFFNQGDVARAGKQTMKLDYENVESPPLHPRCRCTVAAHIEEV